MRNFCNCALLVCCVAGAHANLFEEQVNHSIPDGDASGLASTLNLTGISDSITSLEVTLNISGTYNGDLYAYLVHDGGFSVLLNRVGRTGNNDLGYGDGGLNVNFADGSANGDIHNYRSTLFGNAGTALSGPLTGTWSPDGRQSSPFGVTDPDARTALLGSFDGLDPNGDWTLFVADISGGDLHQLNSWGIEFGTAATAVPDSGASAVLLVMGIAMVLCAVRRRRLSPASTGSIIALAGFSLLVAFIGQSLAATGGNVTIWGDSVMYPLNGYGAKFTKIAAGEQHNLAITTEDKVVAWGANSSGQCNVPASLVGVVAVAAGGVHSLALLTDGTVVAWGSNEKGQCSPPGGLHGVTAIAAGFEYSLALRADGTVAAWGDNPSGQTEVPTGLTGVVGIAAFTRHSLALRGDGTVVAWGDNSSGQCTVPAGLRGVKAVATGGQHSLALKADGTVIAWGNNYDGQCDVPAGLKEVAAIAAGYNHSLALKSDGTVVAWGGVLAGQFEVLGNLQGVTAIAAGNFVLKEDGTISVWWGGASNPQDGLTNVVAIAAGASGPARYTLALKADGTVVPGFDGPPPPSGLHDVVAVAVADGFDLVLKRDGTVACFSYWGYLSPPDVHAPPDGLSGVIAIAACFRHELALKQDGTVVAWGECYYGGECNVPDGLSNVVAIAAGQSHNLALRADGTVAAWGYNDGGDCDVPVDLSNVVAIAVGGNYNLALRADGTVVAWGYPGASEVAGLSHVVAIAAGNYSNLALKEDGSVVAWGGDERFTVPFGLKGVTAVAASLYLNIALFGGTNHPPFAGAYQLATSSGTAASLPLFSLHQVCSDPDWDTFIITGVSASSAVGGTAQITGSSIVYTPPEDFVGSDSFTYTVRDSRGASSQGTVHVTVPAGSGQGASVTGWGSMVVYPLNGYGATFTKIASGFQHNLAIKNDGTVVAWGANGNGGPCDVPPDLAGVMAVAAGGAHSLALKADGTVSAWGYNREGECDVPHGLGSVVAIAAGGSHSLALKTDGTVVAWGNNREGECDVPRGLGGVIAIAAGSYHSLALTGDGTVIAWGDNYYGQCDVPAGLQEVSAIAAGYSHSLALKTDGTVVDWGNDTVQNVPSGLIDVTAVAAGGSHNLALKRDGTVVAWGDDTSGESDVPVGLREIVAVAAGDEHSLALTVDGTIVAWGRNEVGQTAAPGGGTQVVAIAANPAVGMALKTDGTVFQWGSDSFDVPDGLSGVVSISMSSDYHNMALKQDGTVVAWGDNFYGQCDVPPELVGVVGIAAGGWHSLVLRADGTLASWGMGIDAWGPVQTKAPPDGLREVVAIATGSAFGPAFGASIFDLALKEDGTVVAWGTNSKGQCDVPNGLSEVVAISAGGAHSLALKADGTVVAWGYDYWGQCDVPVGLTGVLAIAAGERQSLALKGDGTVVAWGDNYYGQCNLPRGLSGVVSIAASRELSLALFDGIDQPPVTGNYKLETSRNTAKSMPLFKLHQVCSDPDWDSFIITGVSPNTAAGGTAQINGSTILYTPPADFVGSDSFTYAVRDCRGAISEGTVNVTVSAATGNGQNFVKVTMSSSGEATLHFAGIPGVTYVIDASTDLVHWDNIGSARAGANGLFEFVDPQAGNYTSRYYRSRHTP